jgi:hypothetical protein
VVLPRLACTYSRQGDQDEEENADLAGLQGIQGHEHEEGDARGEGGLPAAEADRPVSRSKAQSNTVFREKKVCSDLIPLCYK